MKKFSFFLCSVCYQLFAGNIYVPMSSGFRVAVIDTSSNSVTTTIPLSVSGIGSGAVSPDGSKLYVATGSKLFVISTANNSVITSVTTGNTGSGVAVSPDGNRVYVANNTSNSISVINASNNSLVATIPVGTGPRGIAITPDGNYAYVSNISGNSVSRIQLSNNTIVGTISVPGPVGAAVASNGTYLYVTSQTLGRVFVINTSNQAIVASVGSGSRAVAVTPNSQYAYVPTGANTVIVLNSSTLTIVATVTIGSSPSAIAITPNGSYAYVYNTSSVSPSPSISVIDTTTNTNVATITSLISGGTQAACLTLGYSAPSQAITLNSTGSTLYMIDQTAIEKPPVQLNLGSSLNPQNIALTSNRMYAYVTQNGSNKISYISLDYENLYPPKVQSTISVGTNPSSMVLDRTGTYLYVADSGDNTIYRVAVANNTATLIATLTDVPSQLGINSDSSYLVATLASSDEVAIIASPSSSPSISYASTDLNPTAITFDTSGNSYITCQGSDTVNKIALASGAKTSLLLSGSTPCAISPMTISSTLYFLVAMADSSVVNLIKASDFSLTSSPSITNPATQILVNPNTPSVAYLIEPSTRTIQSIDFTSSTSSPTVGSTLATGTLPIGGGINSTGDNLFILNQTSGTVSAFSTSGTNKATLAEKSGSPISGVGTPQGISVTP